MRRYTTPTLPMTVPVDLTGAEIYVKIKQGASNGGNTGYWLGGVTYNWFAW